MSVFVSYSHAQAPWVRTRLVPCLKAGGVDVRIDVERFRAGIAVHRQMDAEQDACDKHLLILSDEYLASAACRHEMERAIARDPAFDGGTIIPVRRMPCTLPPGIAIPNPLHIDLTDDGQPAAWERLLADCGASLGTTALEWLRARDAIVRHLGDERSVNLVTREGVKTRAWEALIEDARQTVGDLPRVDFQDTAVYSRPGLVRQMLAALGLRVPVPNRPDDLSALGHALAAGAPRWLALTRFHLVQDHADLDKELFLVLRDLVQEKKHLRVLVQSRTPFANLLPPLPVGSDFELPVVDLRGSQRI
ncbi:MAG TPA: toll/interleukin-1 receptor domain-containing protein [Azospirillum sp.]